MFAQACGIFYRCHAQRTCGKGRFIGVVRDRCCHPDVIQGRLDNCRRQDRVRRDIESPLPGLAAISLDSRIGRLSGLIFLRSTRVRIRLVRVWFSRANDTDEVIGEDRMAARQRDLGHVATGTICLAHRTALDGRAA